MASPTRTFRSIIAGITATVTTASALVSAQPASAETITYTVNTASSPQTWSVPAGVTSITVTATGGAGVGATAAKSGFDDSVGGNGASITVTRSVTTGEQFVVHIATLSSQFVYGSIYCTSTPNATQGGYFAAIWASGAPTTDAVVAGGGGGGGCSGPDATNSGTVGDGGDAGLPTSSGSVAPGSAGSNGINTTGGGGGTSSGGGAGGTGLAGGAAGSGGNPAGAGGPGGNGSNTGGVGGGGYYGGGGGGTSRNSETPSGGGGGSSKVDANWDFVSSVANSSITPRIVITTSSAPPAPPAPAGETVTIPTYTFSFDTSDGSPCLADVTVEDGQAYVLPTASVACTPEGSELVGWSIRGQEWAFQPGATVQVSASQTFQAVARLPIISVTYDSNVGMETECAAGAENVTQETRRSSTVSIQRASQEATLATSAPCAPPGFDLIGWTDANTPDGSGQAQSGAQTYEPGAVVPDAWNIDDPNPVNRVRLYALWGRAAG